MPQYLEKRRRVWHAVLDIPEKMRPHFAGKKRLVESLKTESLTEAEARKHSVIGAWKDQFEALRRGRDGKADLIRAEAAGYAHEWGEAPASEADQMEIALDEYVERVEHRHSTELASEVASIIRGETLQLDRHMEAFLGQLKNEPKTIDIKRNELEKFCTRFRYSHAVTSKALKAWMRSLSSDEGIGEATVRRYLSTARGYWTWLRDEELLEEGANPFVGLNARPAKSGASKGGASKPPTYITDADLISLVLAAAEKDLPLARLIWLGMWTGCRIEELCSLRVSETFEDHIRIIDSKTDAGVREVPLHPALTALTNHMKDASTDGYLLSELTVNKYGDRSNAIGKRFGRLKARLGHGSEIVFHSIRKSFITALEGAGVPENIAARINGHELNTMSYGHYSGGVPMHVKAEAVQRVSYGLPQSEQDRIVGRLLHG